MNYPGDMARAIYKYDSLFKKPNSINDVDLPKKHIEFSDWDINQNVDIITIGDSFSNGEARGKNPYYQDYIASIYGKDILNIRKTSRFTDNFIETIVQMNNNGLLDEIKPKVILIQSVERNIIQRFAKDINFSSVIPKDELTKDLLSNFQRKNNRQFFINNKNIDICKAYVFNKFNDKLIGFVNVFSLKKSFFTSTDKTSLLFFHQDITNIKLATLENLKKVNKNLNKLANLLNQKGIKLIFMPTPDKYNIYSEYIINNPYPKSTFFELFKTLNKEYFYINTKFILKEELEKNIQDLYYSDDTHWSYKASEIIVRKVKFD